MDVLLITGCYRSGTTLVEKLLNMHREISIASQPFPVLFFLIKEKFNHSIGIERRYPLGHLFLESDYSISELNSFLEKSLLEENDITEFKQRMNDYENGLWTPEILRFLDRLEPGKFHDVYYQLIEFIHKLYPSENIRLIGSKEVLIEEFGAAMMANGVRLIFVYRDPRAMIASLNFRERNNLTGDQRPVLFSLRAWRKSVALGIEAVSTGKAIAVRYEDIVTHTHRELNRISSFLRVSRFPAKLYDDGIKDQKGHMWLGNSSFSDKSGISKESLDTFQELLPTQVLEYIEATCGPEMELLGYERNSVDLNTRQVIDDYQDPFDSIHASFPVDYSNDPRRAKDEIMRLAMLEKTALSVDTQRRWFLSSSCWSALQKARIR